MPKRVDANQPPIVFVLRAAGASVAITSDLGNGFVDAVVGFRGRNFMIEIKIPGAKLTQHERVFHENWRGQVDIAYTPEDALRIIGALEPTEWR